MRCITLTLGCLLSVGLSSFASEVPASGDFKPMFQIQSFEGWKRVNGAKDTWTWKDGEVIASTGFPIGALRTLKQYENFIMELEWRHMKSAGNAGVFIWASPLPAVGQPFLKAIEVQVLDHGYGNTKSYTTHGDVFAIQGATMVPFEPSRGMRSFPKEQRSKPSPEWNHYRIICIDGVIRLEVNGKEVSGGSEAVWRKGYIGLEAEESPTEWRNIRIQELPGGKATLENTAPLAEDSTNLYDGLSFEGWSVEKKSDASWIAHDWRLKAAGDGAPITSDFLAKGDGEFLLDVAAQEKAEGKIQVELRGSSGKTHFTLPYTQAYTRYIFQKRGDTVRVYSQLFKIEERTDLKLEASVGGFKDQGVQLSFQCDTPALITNPFWISQGK